MAAPVVASVGGIATGTGTTVSVPVPSGVVNGSKVVVFIATYAASALGASSVTPPTGFTLAGFFNWDATNEGVYQANYWFWKDATAADTGSYAFRVPDTGTGYAMRITGAAPVGTSPFVDSLHGAGADANSVTISAFTPGGDNSLLLLGAFTETAPAVSGWTTVANGTATDGNHLGVFSLTQATAVSTSPTATGTGFVAALAATLRAGASVSITAATATGTGTAPSPSVVATSPNVSVQAATASGVAQALAPHVAVPGGWAVAVERARSGAGYARILFVGDSLTEGAGASTRPARFQEKVVSDIRTRYGIPGSAYFVAAGQWTDYDDTWYDDLSSGTGSTGLPDAGTGSRPTTDGLVADYTLGDHGSYLDSGEYRDLTIDGNGFEVVYRNQGSASGAGDIQVYVDSTLVDTIDANTGTARSLQRQHYTCTSGSHTVRLQSTGGSAVVDGLLVYNGDDPTTDGSGLVFYDCAHTGWESNAFGPTSEVGKAFGDLEPDLVVYNMWTNDMFHGRSQATTLANIDANLTAFEALDSQPDVLLWISNAPWDDETTTGEWIDAVADMVSGDHPNVHLVNMHSDGSWMSSGNIDGNAHPNTTGQALEASAVDTALAALVPAGADVTISANVAVATGQAESPFITATRTVSVGPDAATGDAGSPAPVVEATENVNVAPGTATGQMDALEPGVSTVQNASSGPDTATASALALSPSVSVAGSAVVTPNAATGAASSPAPVVQATRTVLVAPGVATASGQANQPDIAAGGNITIGANVAEGQASASAPAVLVVRNVSVDTLAAQANAEALAPLVNPPPIVPVTSGPGIVQVPADSRIVGVRKEGRIAWL
jgi:hypothetical protein